AAATTSQWKAGAASRLCRSRGSRATMIGFEILAHVRKLPSKAVGLIGLFPRGDAPQSPEAGAGRDVLTLPVRELAPVLACERMKTAKSVLSGDGSPVNSASWTELQWQGAQEMTIHVWVFLSIMGLNYFYLGHLSKGCWGSAGACSQAQLASLHVIGETVEWRVGSVLEEVEMPYWPQELMKSRTCCKMDEDCRALPLDLKERWSQYVGADLGELSTKPEVSLLSEAEWPSKPSRAKANVERVEDGWFIAVKLVELGLLKPIAAEQIFQAQGKRVTEGLFAVTKSGSPGPGAARVTRLISNLAPTNAYLRPL
ncbi:unnamed protein product, partial [Prorocentrum cordatum]